MQADRIYMASIVDEEKEDKLRRWLLSRGGDFFLVLRGRGTARGEMMASYGFAETQKVLFLAALPTEDGSELLEQIAHDFKLDKPGKGIAFTLAMPHDVRTKGEHAMDEQKPATAAGYDLILAVTNHGYADMVMDEARAAGARGGTLLYARGTAAKLAEHIARVAIQPEKDMLMIIAAHGTCAAIMEAIAANPTLHDEAATIVFSLPVNAVAGLAFETKEKGKEEAE